MTLIVYQPLWNSGFVNWDDDKYVTDNLKIRDLSWKNAAYILTSTHHGGYEPLTELSFAIEYHFFGLNPRVYHATNLFFHLLNCLLVLWLVCLISGRVGVAFVAALLFGIHPLHVESVAWISERKDLLYAFFFLGSLIAYIYFRSKRSIRYYYVALVLFFVSLLPKPQGLMLPFILLLIDYYQGRKFDRRVIIEKVPFILIALVFAFIAFIGQSAAGELRVDRLFPEWANAIYGITFYLGKLIVPVRLSCLYPFPGESGNSVFSLLFLSTITMLVIYSLRYTRRLIFAGLFFLFSILPVLQLIRTGPAISADRYTYISSIGLFFLAGECLFRLYIRKSRYQKLSRLLVVAMFLLMTVFLSALSWQRCQVWQESEVLWRDVLEKHPDSPIAHNNLGTALCQKDQLDEALFHYEKALEIAPGHLEAHFNRGMILIKQGRSGEAIDSFSSVLRINPDHAAAHNSIGKVLAVQGRLNEAITRYREALRLKPDYAEAHYNLGIALSSQGLMNEAISHFSETVQIRPNYASAYYNMGVALADQGEIDRAIASYAKAVALQPDNAKALNNLGEAYARQGRYEEAIPLFEAALRIDPDYSGARNNLSRALREKGETR